MNDFEDDENQMAGFKNENKQHLSHNLFNFKNKKKREMKAVEKNNPYNHLNYSKEEYNQVQQYFFDENGRSKVNKRNKELL